MLFRSVEQKISSEPLAMSAWAEGRMIYIELTDGRIVGFPADRFIILKNATDKQLKEVSIQICIAVGKLRRRFDRERNSCRKFSVAANKGNLQN